MAKEQYSSEFKRLAVHKLLSQRNGSLAELARELGIAKSTLFDWQQEVAKVQDEMGIKRPKRGSLLKRSAEEKLRLVLEAGQLPDEKLGELLRREGLHAGDLEQWREAMLGGIAGKQQRNNEDIKRIRDLERELRRKDRALAEAAALIVLKKKVEALWEEQETETEGEDDDTESKSE